MIKVFFLFDETFLNSIIHLINFHVAKNVSLLENKSNEKNVHIISFCVVHFKQFKNIHDISLCVYIYVRLVLNFFFRKYFNCHEIKLPY